MFRSALMLLSGNAATSLVLLTRNLLIARLISVEDYGIAATFAIAMSVVEMASALGMEQQIVQSKRGDDPDFQAALQGFTALRGLASFGLLFATAGLMADFLGVPDLAWAYQMMALVPLIRGFEHFDNFRYRRTMRFGPSLWNGFGSAVIAVIVIVPVYLVYPDYRVMLASLLVQAVVSTSLTHFFASRPYRLRFDVATWTGSTRFGWPLLLNGILLFAVMHGEKLVAGRVLGLEALGILAMGLTLTMTPTLVLARSMQTLFLPKLSAAQDDDAAFQRLAEVVIEAVLAATLAYLLAMTLLGGPLVLLLLDEKFAALPPLMALLAVQQTLRVFKTGGSVVALARGQTTNAMIANLLRVASVPIAAWVAVEGGGLVGVVTVATVGEAAGFVVSLFLIRLRLRVSLRHLALPVAVSLGITGVAAYIAWHVPPEAAGRLPGGTETLIMCGAVLVALTTMKQLRTYLLRRGLSRIAAS